MKLLINIDVPDLAAGIDFYCRALELTFTRIIDGDVAELSGAACMLYLLQKSSGTNAATTSALQRQYSGTGRFMWISLCRISMLHWSGHCRRAPARRAPASNGWARNALHVPTLSVMVSA